MRVTVNGESVDLDHHTSIADFLRQRGAAMAAIAVEHNGRLTKREEWTSTMLKENDRLEVVQILGGG